MQAIATSEGAPPSNPAPRQVAAAPAPVPAPPQQVCKRRCFDPAGVSTSKALISAISWK